MGNIFENVGQMHIAVVKDKEMRQGMLGIALGDLAVEAIMSGFGKPAWIKYMSLFAVNKDQLSVLTETQPGEGPDSYLAHARAYIVSNAVCTIGTNTATTNNLDRQIGGATANNNADGQVAKPAGFDELLAGLL